jgi:hypothetical protein
MTGPVRFRPDRSRSPGGHRDRFLCLPARTAATDLGQVLAAGDSRDVHSWWGGRRRVGGTLG